MGEKERAELLLDAWKKTVDVQQHFNQIEMDIRKTAVTIVGAVAGAAGFVAEKGMLVQAWGWRVPVAACVLMAGAVAWVAFGLMDYFWYHRLLKGSVAHGKELETELKSVSVPVDLTNCIGRFSPIQWFEKKQRVSPAPGSEPTRQYWVDLHTDQKLGAFYGLGLAILCVSVLGAWLVVAPSPPPGTQPLAPATNAAP
jgi:hypothetical protein